MPKRPDCPKCGSPQTRFKTKNQTKGKYKIYCNSCTRYSFIDSATGLDTIGEYPYETVWEYVDKKKKQPIDYSRFLDLAKDNQRLNADMSQSQDTGRIKFETSKRYVPIVFSSDWHMGANSADYDALQRHIDMILSNEVYMLLFGDLVDNFVRFRSIQPVLEQVLNPKMQYEMLGALIREFQEAKPRRILAAWWGNHDVQRDEQILGSSRVKSLLAENFIYFNGKGVLELQINDIKYHIGGSHYFKGFSIYNKTHALIRAVRFEFGGLCDVVVMGHLHNYAYAYLRDYELMQEFGYDLGGDIHLLQLGTFNVDDGFGKRFFKKGQVGLPILLFDSEKRDIRWLKNPEWVKEFL